MKDQVCSVLDTIGSKYLLDVQVALSIRLLKIGGIRCQERGLGEVYI